MNEISNSGRKHAKDVMSSNGFFLGRWNSPSLFPNVFKLRIRPKFYSLIIIILFSIDLSPGDPRWVGAWWIGYVIASFAGFSVSLLFACYSRELPSVFKINYYTDKNTISYGIIIRYIDFLKSKYTY